MVLKDIDDALVQAGLDEARNVSTGQVGKLVEKGKLTAEQGQAQLEEILGRIHGSTSYADFGDVDFVIEAVPEKIEIKQAVFAELDAATPGHAILASNTSSLSITEIGEATLRPDKVVGFHYFYPASIMPLIEIVEGEETSAETIGAAVTFAQAIRKQPITCAEVPGFVVNRILNAGISEVWREQEDQGLSIKQIDEGVGAAGVVPMGPYFLVNLLGLDTVLHVAEHLAESYGDERFYVPKGMQRLVGERKLGAKTGGDGFYSPEGEPNIEGDGEPDVEQLVELLTLKTFIEACLVLEEGVATHRDIDFGMMAGAGLDPRRGLLPPFMKADVEGLDTILERLENATERHGERFTPPTILRRLVAQGRLGQQSGQGFYAYPQADAEQPAEVVKLETRADGVAIAWLANGQMNSISPQVIEDLGKVWAKAKSAGVHALVIASSNPFLYSAGADIKAFTSMDEAGGEQLIHTAHALVPRARLGGNRDDRRGQRPRLRRWLRARDVLRRADRRALGAVRPARDQARDHPRLRRHAAPAAPGRLEQGAGDEPRRRPDPRRRGVRDGARQPRSRRPRTARHRARLGTQARRAGPRSRSSRSSASPPPATSTRGSRPRRQPSPPCSPRRTPRRASPRSSANALRTSRGSNYPRG